jgi:F-type H+-transporting ATPase subunit b
MSAPALPAAVMAAAVEEEGPDGIQLLLPAAYDIIWSLVVLAIIAFAFYRYVLP